VLHADRTLAARLEAFAAAEMRRFVATARALDPGSCAALLDVAGGAAVYLGPSSPVNGAFGLGFDGRVDVSHIDELERFFGERQARPLVAVCPLADATLVAHLGGRGWVVEAFENVLVRPFVASESFAGPSEGVVIREALTADEREAWVLAAASGFSDPLPPLREQLELGTIVAARPGARLFLDYMGGVVAGTGELSIGEGIAWLSADATLPRFRGCGVQQSLQRHRLRVGAEAGCELAVSEANPGSTSQRNQERAGFRVAYTRMDVVGAAPSGAAGVEGWSA